MLTPEEDMEIEALKKRGWTISAVRGHVKVALRNSAGCDRVE